MPSAMSQTTLSTKLPQQSTQYKNVKAKVSTLFMARDMKDEYFHSTLGILMISPQVSFDYNSWMKYNLGFTGYFGTGTSSNFYGDEGSAPNSVGLDEANMSITPTEGVNLTAGVIYFDANPILSVLSPNSFLALQQRFQLGANSSNLSLVGTQAIPSAGSSSRRLVDNGSNPSYLSASLQGHLEAGSTTLDTALSHFEFRNLSSNVASECYRNGNAIESFEGSNQTLRFNIGFSVNEISAGIRHALTNSLSLGLKGTYAQNTLAKKGYDQGQVGKLDMTYKSGNFIWTPSYTMLFVQDDVVPSTYTWPEYRYNNRQGGVSSMRLELEKEKLAFTLKYSQFNEINDNPYLADRSLFTFFLDAGYDIL